MSNGAAKARPVGLGVVGLGRLGARHARNIARSVPEARLAMIADENERIASDIAAEVEVPWTRRFEDLIDNDEVEALVIVSPSELHSEMVIKAAARGKHIFCEKPIATTFAETRAAIEAAQNANVQMQVGFMLRFSPHFIAVKNMVASGELGDLYRFTLRARDRQPPSAAFLKRSGGMFADLSIHGFDLARWIMGEVHEITAIGAAITQTFIDVGDIDNALTMLRFDCGALGVIDNSRIAGYGFELSGEILGSRRTVRFGPPSPHGIEILEEGLASRRLLSNGAEAYNDAYIEEFRSFCRDVVRKGDAPRTTAEDALAAYSLASAAAVSHRTGKSVRMERDAEGRYPELS